MPSFCYIFDVCRTVGFVECFFFALFYCDHKRTFQKMVVTFTINCWTFNLNIFEWTEKNRFQGTEISSAGSFFSLSSITALVVICSGSLLMPVVCTADVNCCVCVCCAVLGCVYLWLIILFRHRWIKVHHRRHHFLVIVCWLPRCDTLTHSLVQTTKTHLYSVLSENNLFVFVFDYSRAIM